jgi:hypothetical protein
MLWEKIVFSCIFLLFMLIIYLLFMIMERLIRIEERLIRDNKISFGTKQENGERNENKEI